MKDPFMKLKLPRIADSFFQASNSQNLNGYLTCFTEDATIDDVGDLVNGKKSIADWFTGKDY